MLFKKKYKLLPKESISRNGHSYEVHRIQALVDIPLHGVKQGDLGGYVANKRSLSHKGSCWVGGDAIIYGFSRDDRVSDNALATGNAVVRGLLDGNCNISDNVRIESGVVSGNITMKGNVKFLHGNVYAFGSSQITFDGDVTVDCPAIGNPHYVNYVTFIDVSDDEKIEISGNVNLSKVTIKGNCKLDGDFNLEDISFSGYNTIIGKATIKPGAKFTGKNVISGDTMIPPGTHVHDVVMSTGVLNYNIPISSTRPSFPNTGDTMTPLDVDMSSVFNENTATNRYVSLIEQIEAEYASYTTDIVKLIKHPAMGDASIPETGEFLVKLRSAKRLAGIVDESELKELAGDLELAFVRAENKACTLVASHLDEDSKKSLKTAEQMFSLACNEASTEPEKRLGYKAGMKALEGVVAVSETAVEQMKVKVGILELEA